MRRFLFCIVAIAVLGGSTSAVGAQASVGAPLLNLQSKEYSEGWKQGWDEGWKYVKGEYSYPPYAPYPPYPLYGKDKYKDGYNRGFLAGIAAAKKSGDNDT